MNTPVLHQLPNAAHAPFRCDAPPMPHHRKNPSQATPNPKLPSSSVPVFSFTRPYQQAKTPTSNLYLLIQSP